MPGILLNSFAAANRRSLTSSTVTMRQPHRSNSSNSSLPIPYFRWSSPTTPNSSNESSLASTASSSAVNSPGAASRRKVYHSNRVVNQDDSSYPEPPPLTTLHQHAVWYDSVADASASTATASPASCRPGPPNRHRSASALLWGRELPHDSGMAWGQFVDFDQS
jgi:hypothetical protein